MKMRPSLSLSVAYTSLWMTCLMLLDLRFLCKGQSNDVTLFTFIFAERRDFVNIQQSRLAVSQFSVLS